MKSEYQFIPCDGITLQNFPYPANGISACKLEVEDALVRFRYRILAMAIRINLRKSDGENAWHAASTGGRRGAHSGTILFSTISCLFHSRQRHTSVAITLSAMSQYIQARAAHLRETRSAFPGDEYAPSMEQEPQMFEATNMAACVHPDQYLSYPGYFGVAGEIGAPLSYRPSSDEYLATAPVYTCDGQ